MIQLAQIIPGIVERIAENPDGESTEVVVSALYSGHALQRALDVVGGGGDVLIQMRRKSGDFGGNRYLLCIAGVGCADQGITMPHEWVGVAPIDYEGGA